ncbi:hypothetical protein CIHG_06880 [Coccidioides immitis H538.4]|uniref:Uncharacterized protein n=2 Tax=Coccidioides immitis TaxID=5501 RepID=A0A0J8UNE5_COCIT|nr:hypothetical protein CIRG_04435 [Coccidioides immitis RMSCC 2394]KMU89078.1 hypothetical protein CIHG_06880 [Coccidioides immitis H538.4]
MTATAGKQLSHPFADSTQHPHRGSGESHPMFLAIGNFQQSVASQALSRVELHAPDHFAIKRVAIRRDTPSFVSPPIDEARIFANRPRPGAGKRWCASMRLAIVTTCNYTPSLAHQQVCPPWPEMPDRGSSYGVSFVTP